MPMPDQPLVDSLVQQGLALAATSGGELERSCWMVVHEHHHGAKPTEYDIREIDEDLDLLYCRRPSRPSPQLDQPLSSSRRSAR